MIVATKPGDPAFFEAIKGQRWCDELKLRATVGYTTRILAEDFALALEPLRKNGLGWWLSDAEREAWAFGFDWPDRKVPT
jgi:hypothetical protein